MSDEVFRGVNKYIDYTTMEEHLEYTKPYDDSPGNARAMATRLRHPNGKHNATKKIGNLYHEEKTQVSTYGGRTRWNNTKVYDSHFEFVETWCERAETWTKI